MIVSESKAWATALEVALNKIGGFMHVNDMQITIEAGDGGALKICHKDRPDGLFVEVVVGGALCDLDDPFYTIERVTSYGI